MELTARETQLKMSLFFYIASVGLSSVADKASSWTGRFHALEAFSSRPTTVSRLIGHIGSISMEIVHADLNRVLQMGAVSRYVPMKGVLVVGACLPLYTAVANRCMRR